MHRRFVLEVLTEKGSQTRTWEYEWAYTVEEFIMAVKATTPEYEALLSIREIRDSND